MTNGVMRIATRRGRVPVPAAVVGGILAVAVAVAPSAAFAKGPPDGVPPGQAKKAGAAPPSPSPAQKASPNRAGGDAADALAAGAAIALMDRFLDGETRTIRRYYGSLESGPGKSAGLPPGIAKNLERGKPLPPGIAKKALPQSLVDRLPYRVETRRYVVGNDVVLVAAATGVILDVLLDVL